MSARLFVRKLEQPVRVAARVLGCNPYPGDHLGFGLKYLNRISYFRSIQSSIPIPPPRKLGVPLFKEDRDFVKANRRENRILRGKPPTPKGAKAKGLKKKKK
jgi:hypothetical protein